MKKTPDFTIRGFAFSKMIVIQSYQTLYKEPVPQES